MERHVLQAETARKTSQSPACERRQEKKQCAISRSPRAVLGGGGLALFTLPQSMAHCIRHKCAIARPTRAVLGRGRISTVHLVAVSGTLCSRNETPPGSLPRRGRTKTTSRLVGRRAHWPSFRTEIRPSTWTLPTRTIKPSMTRSALRTSTRALPTWSAGAHVASIKSLRSTRRHHRRAHPYGTALRTPIGAFPRPLLGAARFHALRQTGFQAANVP